LDQKCDGAPVQFSYVDPSHNVLQRGLIHLIEAATGQPALKRLYLDYQAEKRPHDEFFDAAIEKLGLNVCYDADKLEALPKQGPLVVVANHPFGVIDGLMICWLTNKARGDFKILTNAVLCQAPELAHCVLPVDFSETKEAVATNLASRRIARDHLKMGGALIVFPGGTVSTTPKVFGRSVAVDPDWQPFTSHLIRQARASVAPIFFAGQNSGVFQFASHLSPVLRLGLLFNEVRRLQGQSLKVTIGETLAFDQLKRFKSRVEMAEYLKTVTYNLDDR
jgi:putative hemolysin